MGVSTMIADFDEDFRNVRCSSKSLLSVVMVVKIEESRLH